MDLRQAHITKVRLPAWPNPTRVDWIIVGGESGPKARPMHPKWVRDIRDQCEAAGVAFFFKQWGGWGADGVRRAKHANGRLLAGRTWDAYPELTGALL